MIWFRKDLTDKAPIPYSHTKTEMDQKNNFQKMNGVQYL